MRILGHLRDRLRSLRRKNPVLVRSGGLVFGTIEKPDRPRPSGLPEADYLLATGGQRLPNGDIDLPIDPEMLRALLYERPTRAGPTDWLPERYKAAVHQQLNRFMEDLGACSSESSEGDVPEELRRAAFEALKRLALQILALEHPTRDDTGGSRDIK